MGTSRQKSVCEADPPRTTAAPEQHIHNAIAVRDLVNLLREVVQNVQARLEERLNANGGHFDGRGGQKTIVFVPYTKR